MKTARVAWAGAVHNARPHAAGLQLANGTVLREEQVVWLPPFEAGTIIALGLNYADHVKELARELTLSTPRPAPPAAPRGGSGKVAEPHLPDTAKDEPLVFLKTAGALVGHRGHTVRPAGVAFMHYECELAVVIGHRARRVKARDALAHVAGYAVCNDYAVRDHLENWYRPNLRAKNRDAATALGPWLVDAAAVPDPQALALRTRVNGQLRQQGHTSNMVHSVAELIEYLSEFMTLMPGDVILTGTPEGVVNVDVGDVVECEIDGIGCLVNHVVTEPAA
ncbi:MAG: fumarylacetoacetate hydrolase family protein [Delftia acidovorans]|nr:fumarylacetoacetate hydrolase family protein [Delftia acidovorans]